jgi:hypothetical protein
MALIDAIDTYYEYVKSRMLRGVLNEDGSTAVAAINPAQQFLGYAGAQSWPPSDIVYNALYLIITNQDNQPKLGTLGNQMYRVVMQWAWLVQGTDLVATNTGQNRGNRFRIDQGIRDNLRQANFPQFCPMISIQQNSVSGQLSHVLYNPAQTCRWTPLSFGPRPAASDESGILYGAAAVDVYAFQQPMSQ